MKKENVTKKRRRGTDREVLRSRVIEVATEMFMERGIRTVRMEDIAAALGISKRTLYEMFDGKETLLVDIFHSYRASKEAHFKELLERTENVIEVIFAIYKRELADLSKVHPDFFTDLHKYPRLLALFHDLPNTETAKVHRYFVKGVEQGVFRKDINYELVLRIMFMHKAMLIYSELVENYLIAEIYAEITKIHLRGIATEKGSRLFDEFLSKMS